MITIGGSGCDLRHALSEMSLLLEIGVSWGSITRWLMAG